MENPFRRRTVQRSERPNGLSKVGQRLPVVRVSMVRAGRWQVDCNQVLRVGIGDSQDAAIADWFGKNALDLGFDLRRRLI